MLSIPTIRHRLHVRSPGMFVAFILIASILVGSYFLMPLVMTMQTLQTMRLVYGGLAAFLLIAASVYGIRQRGAKLKWGKSKTWLQFHIYGGALFALLVLLHGEFRIPTGTLTWWLWTLSLWITASGFLGTILQKWIPKLLSSGLTVEVIYERIPDLVSEIYRKSEALVGEAGVPLQDFYRQQLAVVLAAPKNRLIYFLDITGGGQTLSRQFDYLRGLLDKDDRMALSKLEKYYKTKLELDAHYTLQKALRWWLFLHAPLSVLLMVLLLFHLLAVVYY